MITNQLNEFENAFRNLRIARPAVPKAIFMVAADAFGISPHATQDNSYIDPNDRTDADLAARQARNLAQHISSLGVPVIQFPALQGMPDAVFPNNVFAPSGTRLLIGAMRHPDRQLEAQRQDIIDFFTGSCGMEVHRLEDSNDVAELTGAYVVDRGRGVGFCGMSDRVTQGGLEWMHREMDHELSLYFDMRPSEYHTNVIMSVLASRALVINPNAFADPEVAATIMRCYADRTIELTDAETEHFAGNCLAVTERDVMLSQVAYDALSDASRERFAALDFLLHPIDVSEVEKGGGSVRCMLGEIF